MNAPTHADPVPRLGFAVGVLGGGGLPSHDARKWRSGPSLSVSLDHLERVFGYLRAHRVTMYRMSSNISPYETHPDLTQFHGQIEACADRLAELGALATADGLRLSMHPGQYTVLNSTEARIRDAAAHELDRHAALLDAMGLGPEAVVVLHVGSGSPSPAEAIERFERAAEGLSEPARRRLVLENDDRIFGLGAVAPLARRLGVPVVWDAHHHRCHDPDGIPEHEALGLALATWPAGVRPKIHYSSPRTSLEETERKEGRRTIRTPRVPPYRSHADLIDPLDFGRFLREAVRGREVDVMLEAKGKDLALLALRAYLEAAAAGAGIHGGPSG